MRAAKSMPKMIRRFRATTDSRNTKVSPNLVRRIFQVERPNACWVSDITYIPTRGLALFSRRPRSVLPRSRGLGDEQDLDAQLAADALTMAIGRRGMSPAIVHS